MRTTRRLLQFAIWLTRIAVGLVAGALRRRPRVPSSPAFRAVETWHPHGASEIPARKALGARLVLERDLDAGELRAVVRELAAGHDPVVIEVYRTDEAYRAASAMQLGAPECRRGFLLSYTQRGADRDITWMQEVGPLSALFGRKEAL